MAAVSVTAQAQERFLELLPPPSGEYWLPTDPIVIRIDSGIPVGRLQRLALELDAFEVTRLHRREGDLAILDLPSALETGEHRLRVVEYRPDDSIVELAVWTVTVRNSAGLRTLELDADVAGNASYRAFGDNTGGAPRWTGQSAGQGTALVGDGDWEGQAFANYLYDSLGWENGSGAFMTMVTRDAATVHGFDSALAPYSTAEANSGWEIVKNFPVREGLNVVRVHFDVEDQVDESDENNIFLVRLIVKLDCDGDGHVGPAQPPLKIAPPKQPGRPGAPPVRTPSSPPVPGGPPTPSAPPIPRG